MNDRYISVAEDALEGSWSVYVHDLPGCTAGGASAEEALGNVQISAGLWLEEARAS
jgi:predicted RNase H-like HicB family nuclease